MSDGDYREKDGGARLEEVWHASIEGCAKWGSVTSAMGLSSAWNVTTAVSRTVPAAHIQEQSRVLCVAA